MTKEAKNLIKEMETIKEKMHKRKIAVICKNVDWNEKGRREGNWELGYDDAMFDVVEILDQAIRKIIINKK